jgi:hypothetical protein
MGDLQVDFDDLENSHDTCIALKSEFDDLPHRVDNVDWSDKSIHDAMHTFGTNWGYHREVLSDKIKEVGEKIESCMKTFKDADQKLYEELEKAKEKHS